MLKLIIFDLDDVLYPEINYIKSGFVHVAKYLTSNSKKQKILVEKMYEIFQEDQNFVFNKLINSSNTIPDNKKSELITTLVTEFRNHKPDIEPYDDVIPILQLLTEKNIKKAILSDGRELSQKFKLESLKIENQFDKIILTDSLGPNRKFWKPNTYGFELIVNYFNIDPNESCYIGDNVSKDFQGPANMGMHTILIRRNEGLYGNLISEKYLKESNLKPDYVINSLYEIENLIDII